jgi:hypothetical protein
VWWYALIAEVEVTVEPVEPVVAPLAPLVVVMVLSLLMIEVYRMQLKLCRTWRVSGVCFDECFMASRKPLRSLAGGGA